MANIRENLKRARLAKLGALIKQAKEEKRIIDKERLISMMIVEHSISRKTAIEEIEAVINYAE